MLLAIDVGNTQTVIGLFGPSGRQRLGSRASCCTTGASPPSAERTADEMALLLAQLLELQGFAIERTVTGIAVASVVPRLRAALREMTERWFPVKTVIVEPGVRTGMPILYDNPKEVGADRIADAVAAFERYGGPTIVIDFGTATTFEAISAKGEYLGGAIVPGIEISLDALFGRAAALRRVELVEPRSVIGKNTVESVQSGVIYGFAAQVDGLCARFEDELGAVHGRGHRRPGRPHRPADRRAIEHHEPWLTLHGLRIIFDRNAETTGIGDEHGPRSPTASSATPPPPSCAARYAGLAAGRRRPASWSPSPGGSCCGASRASWPSAPSGTRPAPIQLFCGASWTDRTSTSSSSCPSATGSASTGEVVATRTGELSVKVTGWVLLAEARRSFGDKWQRHHRRRHPLPPALRRPVGQRGVPRDASCCAAG